VEITGDTANKLGFGGFVRGATANTRVDYTTLDGAGYTRGTATGTTDLQFSINGAASDGNKISVNLSQGNATSGSITGGVVAGGTITDEKNNTLIMTVNGTAGRTVTFGASALTTLAGVRDQINAAADTGNWGMHASLNAAGTQLILASTQVGVGQN